jgi:hypothetical protein
VKLASLEAIVAALNRGSVRYLIAGGLAVNAHGYIRTTLDVDLVVSLDSANVVRAFEALATLGYRPLVPITAAQFADAEMRRGWIRRLRDLDDVQHLRWIAEDRKTDE